MDTKLFLTIIIGILLLGGVFAQIVTATVIEPNNFTFTQTVTATVIEIQNITDTQIVTATVIEPTTIGNETYTPFCALEKENVTFYADVSGPCTEEVIFSIKRNGTWQNFTGEETAEGEDGFRDYSYEVYSCLLNSGLSEWKVYAKDCYGYTYNGSLNEFYVFPRTKLSIIPPEPQGENLWYTTSPRFTLENSDTDKIFYKWRNSNQIYFYSGEFGMEESPIFNEGGTTDLIYWGELSCEQNESTRKQLIKLDLSPPEIENIIPANNSLIQDSIPKIDAKIIDRIERDSGINPSSIVARIDGKIETNCNISESYTPQDFNIRCIPLQELSDGIHNVSIYAEDNSGRSSVFFWKFEVKKLNYDFVLKTYSPDKEIYPETRVRFNLSAGKKINSIEYIDWNNLNPKFTKLCSNCKDYGFSNSKFIVFADGPHNITVRGTSGFVFEKKDFLFMVDTIAPRIYNTTPKSNQPASGLFYVKFEEKNVNKVSLIINKLHVYDVTNCIYDGKYNECTIEVDLSGFEGQKIEYSFNVSDYFRSTSSTAIKVKVNPSSG